MNQDIPARIWSFWADTMEKLDTAENTTTAIPEVLRDLCQFFRFGCCFIYETDHNGTLFLGDSHAVYEHNHLREHLDLRAAIGGDQMEQLAKAKSVIFNSSTLKSALETSLAALFHASTMILLPITDTDGAIRSLVGVVDRRGVTRQGDVDIAYSYSILRVIANHIKLGLYQERALATEQSLRSIMDNMGIDVYVNDFRTHEILYINRSMAEPYGGARKLLGRRCWEALYDNMPGQCEDCPRHELVDEQGQPTQVFSWDYRRPIDGTWFRVCSAAFRWMDGRLAQVVSRVDITENKKNEEIIRQLAEVDHLTGLPNRRKLIADYERLLYTRRRGDNPSYVLFFDLDGFKQVNDTLGHRIGDELLCKVAAFLQQNDQTRGRGYRLGGDEFVVLCPNTSKEQIADTVSLLLSRFDTPWKLEPGYTVCGASIGIASAPYDADDADMLLQAADIAMYAAKNMGGGALFYNGGDICSPTDFFTLSAAKTKTLE